MTPTHYSAKLDKKQMAHISHGDNALLVKNRNVCYQMATLPHSILFLSPLRTDCYCQVDYINEVAERHKLLPHM